MKYRFVDTIKSDVLFEAYGKDLRELFANAAEAMFTIICHDVKPKTGKTVEVDGKDMQDLLYNWLQALIAMVDTEEMFFSGFEIKEISDTRLKAEVYGETVSPEKGETVVKAVTYHKFSLEKTGKGYKAVVSLDI